MKHDIRKYINGDWNVVCDVCGRKRKRSECVLAYGTGIIPVVMSCIDTCADNYHPLNDPPPVIFDGYPVPDARPDQANNAENFVTINSSHFWGHFNFGVWGAFNGLNNEFSFNPIMTWGNFV